MPIPLAALFAAAIYQERSSVAESTEIDRTVALLCRASGMAPTTLEVRGDDLLINGMPLSLEAPGVAIVRHALVDHHTAKLVIPGASSSAQWRAVLQIYASAPGLYQNVDEIRDVVRATIPEAVVMRSVGSDAEGDLRQSLFELPGLRGGAPINYIHRPIDAQDAALAKQLDALLRIAQRARASEDYEAVAQALDAIMTLAADMDAEQRTIVSRERRRVVPSEVLETMARRVPKSGSHGLIARVLVKLGNDGAAALLAALSSSTNANERRTYIDTLVASHDADASIVNALGATRVELVRDAAEVAGRRRMETAVPTLGRLLHHSKVDVRTTAWHALEQIGTREAIAVLRA